MLVALEERSLTPDDRSGQTPFIGCLVNNNSPPPPVFSQTFILGMLKSFVLMHFCNC